MPNQYDRIIKENLRGPTLQLLRKFTGLDIVSVKEVATKVQHTLERELDSLFIVTLRNDLRLIVNIEWQTYNEDIIHRRMLLYYALAFMMEGLPVVTYVIYIGRDKMNMPDSIKHEHLDYTFKLIDLSEVSIDEFLISDVPEEVLLAIFVSGKNEQEDRVLIREILIKLCTLLKDDTTELSRKLMQLEMLGKLRNIQELITKEEKNMALIYDMETDIRFMQGVEKGMQNLQQVLQEAQKEAQKKAEKKAQKVLQEAKKRFVVHLLTTTNYSISKIATTVGVTLHFVKEVKKSLAS